MNKPLPKTKREATKLKVNMYFTGKACKYNHISNRYECNGQCCECMRLSYKENSVEIQIKRALR